MTCKRTPGIASTVVALVLTAVAARVTAADKAVNVSLPTLAKGERVVGFEIHVRSGRIASVPNVPMGWSLSIDNDPSWTTSIRGTANVGAAALSVDAFKEFLTIEKTEMPGISFEIVGELAVTQDFSKGRRLALAATDVRFSSVKTTTSRSK